MWLVLAEPDDHSALWAFQGLKARGIDPIDIVTPQALILALVWEHRLGVGGNTARIRLHTGKTLDTTLLRGVLNRIGYLSPGLFAHAAPVDRQYVMQEMNALFLSWLSAVDSPVLNRPTPQGLCGAWRHSSEWAVLAARADVPSLTFQQSSEVEIVADCRWYPARSVVRTVLTVAGRVISAGVPDAIAKGCERLARYAGLGIAGFEFVIGPTQEWLLAGATPQPDLSLGGESLLDSLYDAIQEKS